MNAITSEADAVNAVGSARTSTCFSERVENVLKIDAPIARIIDGMARVYTMSGLISYLFNDSLILFEKSTSSAWSNAFSFILYFERASSKLLAVVSIIPRSYANSSE